MPSPPTAACLDEQRALDLVDGQLTFGARDHAHAHLAQCPACAALVADLARALGADPSPTEWSEPESGTLDELAAPLGSGTMVGRYRVLQPLAAGGMGVVYVAYDPRLDRNVALKLLRADVIEPEAGARLRREAQALARLSSPHVVTVHAAGDSPYGAFVAMELVKGHTLADWLRHGDGPRPWPQVLARFRAAAGGLRDAHAAGIVHRDFKPSNVLLGEDGRVQVADFGLASTHGTPTPSVRDSVETLDLERVTRTGGVVGTPAYMAPEQLAGHPADARSDQFALCVALFEGLYGERPFPGTTLHTLMESLEHGRIRRIDSKSTAPRWIHRAIVRGLSSDPQQRYPDMGHLLDALDPRSHRRRRSSRIAAIALVGSALAALWVERASAPVPCTEVDPQLAAVWNDERRAAIASAFTATPDPGAVAQLAQVTRTLDTRTQQWRAASIAACEATGHSDGWGEHLDQRMQCLQTALDETDEAIDLLASADRRTVQRADTIVPRLTRLEDCDDPDYLDAVIKPPDPASAIAVQTLRRDAARARTRLATTHDLGAAVDQLRHLHRRAQDLDYAPLEVSIAVSLGRSLRLHGDIPEAITQLEPTYFAALELGDQASASEAASILTMAHGHGLGQIEQALRWSPTCRGRGHCHGRSDPAGGGPAHPRRAAIHPRPPRGG